MNESIAYYSRKDFAGESVDLRDELWIFFGPAENYSAHEQDQLASLQKICLHSEII